MVAIFTPAGSSSLTFGAKTVKLHRCGELEIDVFGTDNDAKVGIKSFLCQLI